MGPLQTMLLNLGSPNVGCQSICNFPLEGISYDSLANKLLGSVQQPTRECLDGLLMPLNARSVIIDSLRCVEDYSTHKRRPLGINFFTISSHSLPTL